MDLCNRWHCLLQVVEGTDDADNNKRHAIIIKDVAANYKSVWEANNKRTDNLHTIGLSTAEDGVRTILVVRPEAWDYEYEAVIIHEIGHAVAMLDHNESEDAVMFANLSLASMHLTQNDLNAFCDVYGCELILKPWCSNEQ